MELVKAIEFIQPAIKSNAGNWADIGAGTGLFCQALHELLPIESSIYALDKNPHGLYRLDLPATRDFHIVEGDFEKKMRIPSCEGVLMGNALHYAKEPIKVLENVLGHLTSGGQFLIIEYETKIPNPPWIPYPIPFEELKTLLKEFPLTPLKEIGRVPSRYGAEYIYAGLCEKL